MPFLVDDIKIEFRFENGGGQVRVNKSGIQKSVRKYR